MPIDLSPTAFFDLSRCRHADLFDGFEFVWQAIGQINTYLKRNIGGVGHQIEAAVMEGAFIATGDIVIGPGTVVEPGAYIAGPSLIGANCEIRQGAYIRGNALISDGCVIGHNSEIKNAVLLSGAGAPHFNYVGDSILGCDVNLGAGTKLSNLAVLSAKDSKTGKRPTIHLTIDDQVYDTGLAKFGAIIGDSAQTGCNSVLNPGVLLGPRSLVYANTSLPKGYYPPDSIIKLRQTIEISKRRLVG